jgi:hypothetical protein
MIFRLNTSGRWGRDLLVQTKLPHNTLRVLRLYHMEAHKFTTRPPEVFVSKALICQTPLTLHMFYEIRHPHFPCDILIMDALKIFMVKRIASNSELPCPT